MISEVLPYRDAGLVKRASPCLALLGATPLRQSLAKGPREETRP